MIRVIHTGSRSWFFTHPSGVSRGQKGTGSRIRNSEFLLLQWTCLYERRGREELGDERFFLLQVRGILALVGGEGTAGGHSRGGSVLSRAANRLQHVQGRQGLLNIKIRGTVYKSIISFRNEYLNLNKTSCEFYNLRRLYSTVINGVADPDLHGSALEWKAGPGSHEGQVSKWRHGRPWS